MARVVDVAGSSWHESSAGRALFKLHLLYERGGVWAEPQTMRLPTSAAGEAGPHWGARIADRVAGCGVFAFLERGAEGTGGGRRRRNRRIPAGCRAAQRRRRDVAAGRAG